MNLVSKALIRYRDARIQITPAFPTIPMNKPTIAGPMNTGKPAPKFKIDIAAPLSFFTSDGTRADKGTYPASVAPQIIPEINKATKL